MCLAPAQDTTYEDMFSKQLQIIENAAGRIAVLLERANFSSKMQEYKNEYITFLKHAINFIKHQPSGNMEQNSPFKSKVTNNMEKSYTIE